MILGGKDFKDWFGNGRKDSDGNPVIDTTLSLTNEKGEKKTVFDFQAINFENTGEVQKLLISSPAIHVYNSSLFINNTKTNTSGKFLAQDAMRLINTINFYYPGLLSIDNYRRKGESMFSKSAAIPVPVVKINPVVLTNSKGMFSIHETSLQNKDENRFNQIRSIDALEELKDGIDEYRVYGVDNSQLEIIANPPEVDLDTYNKLTSFFNKLSPKARVEVIDSLPTAGAAYINDFLIRLDTNQKFQAMPEEVSHFFVELLPLSSELRKDILDNITNFVIYQTTLNTYKSIKEYQLPNGNINYDKIKREAAAKLIGEYVNAISTNDNSRINILTKTKDGFIKRWWDRFIKWITFGLVDARKGALKSYREAANNILNEDISPLTLSEVFKSIDDDVFFRAGDADKVVMAEDIVSKVMKAGKIDQLQNVVNKFRYDLRDNFIKIVKQKAFDSLNKQLSLEQGRPTDINYLGELYDILKTVNVSEKQNVDMLASESQVRNFSEFLYVISNMEKLALAIDTITDKEIGDGDFLNDINEIQAFRQTYENFHSFINSDLMRVLSDSEVETTVRTQLAKTATIFSQVEFKMLNKLRGDFGKYFAKDLAKQNKIYLDAYLEDMKKILSSGKSKDTEAITKAFDQYRQDMEGNMSKKNAQLGLLNRLDGKKLQDGKWVDDPSAPKIPAKVLNSGPMAQLFTRLNSLYFKNQAVEDLLNGLGKDVDALSSTTHMVMAAIKNHDPIISNIANYINTQKSQSQNLAQRVIRGYFSQIDPILKSLKSEHNIDEYKSGELITYIDEVEDHSVDEKTGVVLYPEGRRKIVKFLDPTTNDLLIESDRLFSLKNKLYTEWKKDENSTDGKAAKESFRKAKKEYNDFQEEYFNSRYTDELTNFHSKYNSNPLYLEIREEWDGLSEEERHIWDFMEGERGKKQDYTRLAIVRQQKAALLSETGKTGDELVKAKILKEYFKESNKFRVEDARRTERNYNLARVQYEDKLDNAISRFIRDNAAGNRDLNKLESTLKRLMRDDTISIVSKYRYNAIGDDRVDLNNITGENEVILVRDILLDEWESRNTVRVRNDKFYEQRDKLQQELERPGVKAIMSKVDIYMSELSTKLYDILTNRNDEYGERDPLLLTPEEKETVDGIEDAINAINDALSVTGRKLRIYKMENEQFNNPEFEDLKEHMTKYDELADELYNQIKTGGVLKDPAKVDDLVRDIAEYNEEFEKRGIITKKQIDQGKAIAEIRRELAQMSDRIPSQNYLEKIERLIPILEEILSIYQNKRKQKGISTLQATNYDEEIANLRRLLYGTDGEDEEEITGGLMDAIYDGNYLMLDKILNDEYFVDYGNNTPRDRIKVIFKKYIELLDEDSPSSLIEEIDPEFFDWFHESHTVGKYFTREIDPITQEQLDSYEKVDREYVRRVYYSYSAPAPGLYDVKYAKKYRATKIADEYYAPKISWKNTDSVEDWTVDNKEGNPEQLPMSRKQRLARGKTSTKYLNGKYYKLIDSKSTKDNLLKQMHAISIKTYFQEQESKPDRIKAGFNLPVTSLDQFSKLKANATNLPDRVKRVGQKIKGVFMPSEATDAEDMIAGIDQMRDVDEVTQEIMNRKFPALGMNTKIPVERVNRNVIAAVEEYIKHSKDFDTRVNLMPFMKALIDVMKSNEDVGNINQKKRRETIEKIYSQMILHEQPDNITNHRFFRKMINTIMTFTAFRLTADITGGAINYIQANINNIVEAFAGKYVTPTSYALGYWKASEMIKSMTADFNKKSNLSYWTLMYQTFDFIQGEWEEDLFERTSTKNKTFNWRKILMYPRKNGELHAQSAMAIAILNNTKVLNKLDNKEYPVWNIYKKQGDDLVLKDGFYDEDINGEKIYPWNPENGEKFKEIKNLIWSVNMDLHGNYANINQTEASRHSIGKLAENLKRWFVQGFTRRFGREGVDVNKPFIEEGYYRTTIQAFKNIFGSLITFNLRKAGDWSKFYFTTDRKKANLKRFATEMVICIGLYMIGLLGFGYDGEDKDKNKKLKASSWFHNEMLLIALRTYAEQTAYIPVPPFGFTEMSRNLLDPFSVAKSTFGNAVGLATLAWYTTAYYLGIPRFTEKDVFYQKDTGGILGHKGDLKIVQYLAKTFGFTGAQLDPAFYLQNFQSLQNRIK